jgi:hypothetical protein
MGIRRDHFEIVVVNVFAVEVGGWGSNANIRIGGVTVAASEGGGGTPEEEESKGDRHNHRPKPFHRISIDFSTKDKRP